jgi:hypothetical protein
MAVLAQGLLTRVQGTVKLALRPDRGVCCEIKLETALEGTSPFCGHLARQIMSQGNNCLARLCFLSQFVLSGLELSVLSGH